MKDSSLQYFEVTKFADVAPSAELSDWVAGWMNGHFYDLDGARPHKSLKRIEDEAGPFPISWKTGHLYANCIAYWRHLCLAKPEGDWDGFVHYVGAKQNV